jgi:hypothetical protein
MQQRASRLVRGSGCPDAATVESRVGVDITAASLHEQRRLGGERVIAIAEADAAIRAALTAGR